MAERPGLRALVPSVSTAQPRPEFSREAIEAYQQGVEAYDRGDLETAIRLFRESFEEHHGHPNALYNVGECYERLGDVEQAVAYFERYVASDLAEDREQVYERIGNLRNRPAVFTLRSDPTGATVTVFDDAEMRIAEYAPVTTPGEMRLPPAPTCFTSISPAPDAHARRGRRPRPTGDARGCHALRLPRGAGGIRESRSPRAPTSRSGRSGRSSSERTRAVVAPERLGRRVRHGRSRIFGGTRRRRRV